MTRIAGMPPAAEIDLKTGAEIHRVDILRDADVAEIAGGIARGDIQGAAKSDREMREVPADPLAFLYTSCAVLVLRAYS